MAKRQSVSGKFEEVVYTRLNAGDDLLRAFWEICEEHDIKTGLILECTGSMANVRMQRFGHDENSLQIGAGIDVVNIRGPLEVTASGVVGTGWVPDKSVTPPPELQREGMTGFGFGGFKGHETPYCHVHIVVSSNSETVCGHLLEGSYLSPVPPPEKVDKITGRGVVPEHFTVAIAKVSGVTLRMVADKQGVYHDLVPV
ncbi:PCC domain-containing protein [Bradyrhizobium sp. USDA 3315]